MNGWSCAPGFRRRPEVLIIRNPAVICWRLFSVTGCITSRVKRSCSFKADQTCAARWTTCPSSGQPYLLLRKRNTEPLLNVTPPSSIGATKKRNVSGSSESFSVCVCLHTLKISWDWLILPATVARGGSAGFSLHRVNTGAGVLLHWEGNHDTPTFFVFFFLFSTPSSRRSKTTGWVKKKNPWHFILEN